MAAFLRAAYPAEINEKVLRRELESRLFHEKCDPLAEFTDGELYSRYKFDRNGILFVTELLKGRN